MNDDRPIEYTVKVDQADFARLPSVVYRDTVNIEVHAAGVVLTCTGRTGRNDW